MIRRTQIILANAFSISVLAGLIIGAMAPSVSRAEDLKPDANGYIHDWLLLAPIPLEEGETGDEAIGFNVIRREPTLQPREGDKMVVAGYERTWKKITSETDIFDFNKTLGKPTDRAIGYLVAYIDCPKEITGVNLLAGGNDQARVYFNGVAVSTVAEARSLTKDSDIAENLTLNKGINTVILKIVNETGNWQGCLRFADKKGRPITDFNIKLSTETKHQR